MSGHERHVINIARAILTEHHCGVDLPQNPDDAVEHEDAFATAIFDAISDECHHTDPGDVLRHVTPRLRWMSEVLNLLARGIENELHAAEEFDANDVTDPGSGASAFKT